MATYLEQSLKKLEEFEGSIPWMYRDTVGRVTVGVGLMLPDAAAARKLPFRLAGRAASEDEIAREYARVDALPMGRAAGFYRREAAPELAQETIDSLLRGVLTHFEEQLRGRLLGYDSFPDAAKMALLDMAYNLGPSGLLKGYPKMMQAVGSGAWQQASQCCLRHGPGAARNEWTREMFLSAGQKIGAELEEAASLLAEVGYGLLGVLAAGWQRARRRW